MAEENKTITIEKATLWKIAFFIVLGVLIIFVLFGRGGTQTTTGKAIDTTKAANTEGNSAGDLSAFENSALYPSLGPKDAKTTVIEFSDFQCPYCALASGLPTWISQYSQYADLIGSAGKIEEMAINGELRFIYVSMSFLGPESVYAAQAGLCANDQEKFWEMHDAIFQASDGPSENTGKYSIENLEALASGIKEIDTAKFNECLESEKHAQDVQTIAAQAKAAGVSGTPTFIVNGQKVSASWNSLYALL